MGVVTASGDPVVNASVILANDNSNHVTTTGADGRFALDDVDQGDYVLTIKAETENNKFIQYQKNVRVLQENSEQTIELPAGVTLHEPSNVTDRSIELTWSKSTIPNFLEYKLYRHNTSGLDETTGELIHVSMSADDTVFTDIDVAESQAYFYRVFVRNDFGLYGGSNITNVTTSVGNYVENGDFEAGLDNWSLTTQNSGAVVGEDVTSPAGKNVLELNLQVTSGGDAGFTCDISQNKFAPGQTYVLSFWAKADIPTNGKTYIILSQSGVLAPMVVMALTQESSKEWTKYTAEFIAPTFISPAHLEINANQYWPYTEPKTYTVLFDGFDIHRK